MKYKLLMLLMLILIIPSAHSAIDYCERCWLLEESEGLGEFIAIEFIEIRPNYWEVEVKLDEKLKADIKSGRKVEEVFNKYKHKIKSNKQKETLEALKKINKYPIQTLKKICPDDMLDPLDCYYEPTNILKSNYPHINLLDNSKFNIDFGGKFVAGEAVKIGFNSITYSAATNIITYTDNGSEIYEEIYQADVAGGWGKVTKTDGESYTFDATIIFDGGCTCSDYSKQIQFTNAATTPSHKFHQEVKSGSNVSIGEIHNEAKKITKKGCQYIELESGYSRFTFIARPPAAVLNLYSCSFLSRFASYDCQIKGMSRVWNTAFYYYGYPGKMGGQTITPDLSNVVVSTGKYGYFFYNAAGETSSQFADGLIGMGGTASIRIDRGGEHIIKNAKGRGNTYWVYIGRAITYNNTFLNPNSDAWNIRWYSGTSTAGIFRAYEFDVKVMEDNGSSISGATVELKDINNNTVFSLTTNSSGAIETQNVSYKYYKRTSTATYSPHTLNITMSGYQDYSSVITVDKKMSLEVALLPECEGGACDPDVLGYIPVFYGIVMFFLLALSLYFIYLSKVYVKEKFFIKSLLYLLSLTSAIFAITLLGFGVREYLKMNAVLEVIDYFYVLLITLIVVIFIYHLVLMIKKALINIKK